MNKKILFIQPTIYDEEGKLLKRSKLYFVGLAHPLLSALLPEVREHYYADHPDALERIEKLKASAS